MKSNYTRPTYIAAKRFSYYRKTTMPHGTPTGVVTQMANSILSRSADRLCVFEVHFDTEVCFSGILRAVELIRNLDMFRELCFTAPTSLHVYHDDIYKWFSKRNSLGFTGSLYTLKLGTVVPAGVPVIQVIGGYAECIMLKPILEHCIQLETSVATSAHRDVVETKAKLDLVHDCAYNGTHEVGVEALAAYCAGYTHTTDQAGNADWNVPSLPPIMSLPARNLILNYRDLCQTHIDYWGTYSTFEIQDLEDAKTVIDLVQHAEGDVHAFICQPDVIQPLRQLLNTCKWTSDSKIYVRDRLDVGGIDGIVRDPAEGARDLKCDYRIVELDDDPVDGTPGRLVPLVNWETKELTAFPYSTVIATPELIKGLTVQYQPAIRNGVVMSDYKVETTKGKDNNIRVVELANLRARRRKYD